jgi:DNA-binding PadR family transcriptional regulator
MTESAMSRNTNNPNEFVPLSNLAFHILLALGAGPSHGYAIGKEVEERSQGKLNPTTGGLYQALKRLTENGLVEHDEEAASDSSDSRRQYFRLTALGRDVAALEARRLSELVARARERNLFTESA